MNHAIHVGNALEVLKQMPAESVNCVVTSPPYWGLRAYGTEPQIWDGDENCGHEWGEKIPYSKFDSRTPEEKKQQGAIVGNSVNSENFSKGNSGNFCLKCSAWRGELGLEPTFALYIQHLLSIFDEIKRVLRKDGTCWVNLGSTFCSKDIFMIEDEYYG